MTVLRPSLPPLICTITKTLPGSAAVPADGTICAEAARMKASGMPPPSAAAPMERVRKAGRFICYSRSVELVDGRVERQGDDAPNLLLVVFRAERLRVGEAAALRLRAGAGEV